MTELRVAVLGVGVMGADHVARIQSRISGARVSVVNDYVTEKAEQIGVPVENIFSTLGTYLGSAYINDFNYLGRTWRVTAQADAAYRQQTSDIERLRTRSNGGGMVPLAAVMTLKNEAGPYRVVIDRVLQNRRVTATYGSGGHPALEAGSSVQV